MRRALIALAALALSCEPPESRHPLSDPASAKPDRALAGTWAGWLDDERAVLHVVAHEEKAAWVDVLLVGDDDEGAVTIHFEGFPTNIRGTRFLNLRPKRFLDPWGEKTEVGAGWIFVRYDIAKDGTLRLAYVDGDAAKKAISVGRLSAIEEEGGFRASTTVLTSGTGALIAFVTSAPDPFKPLARFKKQKLDPGPKR